MFIGLELLYSWLASSNHCSSPLVLTLVEQETREIKPYQEDVELINLGKEGEEKKVKIS